MRRVGTTPLRGRTYTRRPGVYAILPRDGKILLTHQSEPIPEFQLPGGGIDPGESPIYALHREVLEETGWRITGARRMGAFKRFVYMEEYDLWAEKICHVYVARPTRALGTPSEAIHSACFVDPEVAIDLLDNPGDASFLRQYMD